MSKKGKVYLVGGGPGDPGLITVRGRRLLQEADLVVYDALAPVALLNEVRVGCRLIDAGKRSGRHRLKQAQISRLLIRAAKAGKQVVRLKGGDPFLFGRGAEEGESLSAAGISFEVVPGVSSALAVPAYAGIPLTHREVNSTVTVLTGHGEGLDSEAGPAPLDWAALAQEEVLVLLMGMRGLAGNMRALLKHGRSSQTPVAVTEWGTLPHQRTVTGTLKDIASQVKRSRIVAPAVVIVGDIVKRRRKLNWFETKPLFGKRVLITRARHQAGILAEHLQAEAAQVIEIPTIEIRSPRSWKRLDDSIRQLSDMDWLILTSANGVQAFFARLQHHRLDARALAALKIAVIGPATADSLRSYGIEADVVANSYRAEGLLTVLPARQVRGRRVLLARAAEARAVLPDGLKQRGAHVTIASCYQSRMPQGARGELKSLMRQNPPDLVVFASSSMVENYVRMLHGDAALWRRIRRIPVACIGPITAETARAHRLNVLIQPKQYTIPDLVAAIVRNARKI